MKSDTDYPADKLGAIPLEKAQAVSADLNISRGITQASQSTLRVIDPPFSVTSGTNSAVAP